MIESLNIIKEYRLLRENIDSLVELTTWPGKKNPMEAVDGRVKAALTRAYNKEVEVYTYSAATTVKKKKTIASDEDYMNEYEENGDQFSDSTDEDTDNIDNDALIKQKKSSTSKASGSSKASTSEANDTTKRPRNTKKKS